MTTPSANAHAAAVMYRPRRRPARSDRTPAKRNSGLYELANSNQRPGMRLPPDRSIVIAGHDKTHAEAQSPFAVAALRDPHNPEVAGSNPAPATKEIPGQSHDQRSWL